MSQRYQGKFIVLDGPDGCGKSTQVKQLVQWLQRQGVEVVTFRDPGDTRLGELIRDILLSPEHDRMSTRTELLLYMASRAQLWTEKIGPALEQGQCVVLDRWISSTCAYQGYAGGDGVNRVIDLAEDCLDRIWPDATIILDVDQSTANHRMNRELDRMERKGPSYHQRVREGFLRLAASQANFKIVDAREPVDVVHRAILRTLQEILSEND